MAQDWFDQMTQPVGAPASPSAPPQPQAPGVIYGRPKRPDPYQVAKDQQQQAMEAERLRLAQEANARAGADQTTQQEKARRDALEWQATHNPDGSPKKKEGDALPAWAANPFEGQISAYGGVKRGLDTFQDAYAGNTITGGLENSIQGLNSGFGTPGQRDWWAQFASTDNIIRNDLFGSALTETEKQAYAATSINPTMDPAEVRRNLQSRESILREALQRRVGFLRAQGYNQDAIAALAGQYAEQLGAVSGLGGAAQDATTGQAPVEQQTSGAPRTATKAGPYDLISATLRPDGQYDLTWGDGRKQVADSIPRAVDVTGDITAGPDQRDNAMGAADAFVRGAADTMTLGFSDELAAAGDTLFSGGTFDDNLRRQRAIDAYDAQNSPWLRLGGQLAGGLALPAGNARTAMQGAKLGGAYGAAYGFGSGEDGFGNRLLSGAAGGLTGAAAGGLLTGGMNALMPRGGPKPPSNPEGRAVYEAAQRQGVDVLPADVGGDITRRVTSGAVQTPFGAGPILNTARRAQDQAGNALQRVASERAAPGTQYAAGRAAQRGAERFVSESEKRASRLYDEISVPDAQPAVTDSTVRALEAVTQGMDSNPELSRIWTGHPRLRATLETLNRPNVRQRTGPGGYPMLEKEVIENGQKRWVSMSQREIEAGAPEGGQLSWADMKRLRSIVGDIIGKPSLTSEGPEISAMRAFYAGLSEDMRATAERVGPKALRQFERANGYFRGRQSRIESVIAPILGKDGSADGQAAFNAIQRWSTAKGESSRVVRLIRSLPADEAETIGATIISELGRPSAGRLSEQNSFSLADFATHWNKLDPMAKAALFTKSQRAALNDLFTVASGTKEAQRFANSSNTAGAMSANLTTGGLAAGGGALVMGHPLAALAATAPAFAQYVTGRMMASPRFVQWLTRTAKAKSPEAQQARIKALAGVVAREPALAQEVTGLQQYLVKVANDNFGARSAASEKEQKQRENNAP